MLNRFRYFSYVATLAALTSLTACGKDDPKPAADAVGMSWSMDGNNVTAAKVDKDVSGTEIELTGSVGSATSASIMQLTVPKKVGTYTFSATSDASAFYTTGTSSSAMFYGSESGTLTVTSYSATNVAGTFTFTGKGEDFSGTTKPAKTISSGKFNVAL